MNQSQRLQKLFSDVAQRMQISCSLPLDGPKSPVPENLKVSSVTPQLLACINAANKVHDICAKMELHRCLPHDHDLTDDTWTVAHEQQAQAWAEDALNRVRDLVTKYKLSADKAEKRKKPAFKHEYTPLLDKYFEFNAYPSAPDRLVLARKSGMTARQIEVWFQNHRNRARKERRELRKLSESSIPLELTLKSLERTMPFLTVPKHERKTTSTINDSCEEEYPDQQDRLNITSTVYALDSLNPPRPDHAFPAKYYRKADPWSSSLSDYKFTPPIWSRRQSTVRQTIETPINIEEFILNFGQKLHLRTPLSTKARPTNAKSWYASKVTILPPAPHPALYRTHIPSSVFDSPALTSPSLSPSPFSTPSTSASSAYDKHAYQRAASLPKRTHTSPSPTYRHRSPDTLGDSSTVASPVLLLRVDRQLQ
ncbi:hypothetical protein C0993_006435 [Termitomyces sp. T159_Od127]|nr:hypothetical protein C0993_006435 [Termitomyces sp. T159_Od127]